MTVYTDRFDYMGHSVRRRIGEAVRDRRRKALDSVSQICVSVTTDGHTTREVTFDTPPTLSQLVERIGKDAIVVAVGKRRRTRRTASSRPLMLTAS